ncbi:MAG TPA: 30S ribosomal protein S16 [Candidatus Hydrogenedentes bacterium]|nr:30S ribosomal protein S16 [Candidatus Hydrogenedentota bacterium]
MATVIRLKRGGRKKKPYYRIVVQDSRNRTRGREVEILGVYHPAARPAPISEVNAVRALEWLRQGAQPSDTVRAIFSKLGVMKHFGDGTTPETETAQAVGAVVEDKGYTPPAPVVDEPKPAPAAAEAEAPEAAEEAPAADAAPEEAASEEQAAE